MFENVDRHIDRHMPDGLSQWYTISSPMSQRLMGELKVYNFIYLFL